jgi:hypothetical protein
MGRKLKLPAPRKLHRNPMARALGAGKFQARVVPRESGYRRKPKHPKPAPDEG